ncbi:1-deoxy-D-xylulose-5-phosphate synthase N-terminal domain-containing protein, partial [Pseudomonas aeruginosa]
MPLAYSSVRRAISQAPGRRESSKKVLSRLPGAWEIARRTEEYAKGMLVPGTLFEELGWNYIG